MVFEDHGLRIYCIGKEIDGMGWLRLVGSFKL